MAVLTVLHAVFGFDRVFFSVFWFLVIFFYDFGSDKSTLEVEILLLLGSTFEFNSHQYGSAPKRFRSSLSTLSRLECDM